MVKVLHCRRVASCPLEIVRRANWLRQRDRIFSANVAQEPVEIVEKMPKKSVYLVKSLVHGLLGLARHELDPGMLDRNHDLEMHGIAHRNTWLVLPEKSEVDTGSYESGANKI